MSRDYFDSFDSEDEYQHEERRKNAKGGRSKGHQSKRGKPDRWEAILTEDLPSDPEQIAPIAPSPRPTWEPRKPQPSATPPCQAPADQRPYGAPQIVFGPNTHTIKNVQIDFDRVAAIAKTENDHNGRRTYGITFFFSNRKKTFRTVWFNANERERDSVFEAETSFWESLHR